jgi:hypothetical protein
MRRTRTERFNCSCGGSDGSILTLVQKVLGLWSDPCIRFEKIWPITGVFEILITPPLRGAQYGSGLSGDDDFQSVLVEPCRLWLFVI